MIFDAGCNFCSSAKVKAHFQFIKVWPSCPFCPTIKHSDISCLVGNKTNRKLHMHSIKTTSIYNICIFFSTCTHQEVIHFCRENYKPYPHINVQKGPRSARGHSKCKSRAKGRWVGVSPNYLAEWFDFPESPIYPLEGKKFLMLWCLRMALTEVVFFFLSFF